MGGPVYKAALSTLDTFLDHCLFRGAYQGHIYTAFFRDLGWTYTMLASHKDDDAQDDTEPLRNCFWARHLSLVPIPTTAGPTPTATKMPDSPSRVEKASPKQQPVLRARIAVNHLTFSAATPTDRKSPLSPKIPKLPVPACSSTSALGCLQSSSQL